MVKSLPANAGDTRDMGSIPGSGKSPGVGNSNQLQHCCLKNSMDRGVWWAAVYGVAEFDMTESLSMHAFFEGKSPCANHNDEWELCFLKSEYVHKFLEFSLELPLLPTDLFNHFFLI